MNNKSIRLRTIPGQNKNIQIKVDQDFDFLEVLSLKLSQEDLYKTFCANYGVVVGRVIANKGFGLPNAKVSVFVPITSEDEKNQLITDLYPYKTSVSKDSEGIRYNLLLSESTCSINTVVGTFPTKEQVIDNDIVIEIFEKYYKYTTTTNNSGDYMIFGVPVGQQTVHMDVDLSDVSIASVRPYDLIDEGYPEELFEGRTEFKDSTNLDSLPQIKSGNIGVDVIPFWGDEETCEIGITRVDFDTNFEITPRSLFMGSVMTDDGKQSLNKTCNPRDKMGDTENVTTNKGNISILRVDGYDNNTWFTNGEVRALSLEEYPTPTDGEIDENGAFAFSLPMNLGHVITDEFGNLVPSPDPEQGIATKAMYRFAMGINSGEGRLRRTAKLLFPSLGTRFGGTKGKVSGGSRVGTEDQRWTDNIFEYSDDNNNLDGTSYATINRDFHLFEWKQVYSIAQYIKKYKKGNGRMSFIGLKNTDHGPINPIPFNNILYKPNVIFVVISFIIQIISFLIKFFVFITSLQFGIYISSRASFGKTWTVAKVNFGFAFTLWDFCTCVNIRPFFLITKLFPKLCDQEGSSEITEPTDGTCTCPNDDSGFILGCQGDATEGNYCVNLTSPNCPSSTSVCGEIQKTISVVDCATTVSSSNLHFKIGAYFIPDDVNRCAAIQSVIGWTCCVITNLAESQNVWRRCFFDNWLVGSSYMFQFKFKKRNSGKEKFCGPGADNRASDRYRRQDCCYGDDPNCKKCLLRGPNQSRNVASQIADYHITEHNAAQSGAKDLDSIIYCNETYSTKIVSLGPIELCEDALNDIENCINNPSCQMEIYKQNNNTGTFYEEGWDSTSWSNNMETTSYQSPIPVLEYLLRFTFPACRVDPLFREGSGCHEYELENGDNSNPNIYGQLKEVSKIYTDIILNGNNKFTPGVVVTSDGQVGSDVEQETNDSGIVVDVISGYEYDNLLGLKFSPSGQGSGSFSTPPNWNGVDTLQPSGGGRDNDDESGWYENVEKNIPYFYFGVRQGGTAIEKLKSKFFVNK
jgi:hypothetical protein